MRRKSTILAACLALLPAAARGDDDPGSAKARAPFLVIGDTNAARLALESAKRTLAAGETLRGVREIQRVLDHFGNGLVLAEEDSRHSRWLPAPEAARRLIEGLPPDARRAYDEEASALARPLLDRAVARRDEAAFADLVFRFAASSVGLEAARLLAESAFERGRPFDALGAIGAALRFWPNDAGLWLRAVDARVAAGDAQGLATMALPEGLAKVLTAEGEVDVKDRLAAARAATPVPHEREDWPAWGGGPDHDRAAPGDPRGKALRWSTGSPVRWRENDVSRFFNTGDEPQKRLQSWDATSPYFPALLDRTLYVADGRGVVAVDLYSGRAVWVFPAPGKLPPGLPIARGTWLKGRTNVDTVFAPCVDGGLVFATVEVERPYSPRWLQEVEITTYLPRRVIVALDAENGRLRWRMGGVDGDLPALKGLSIAGPPAVKDGIVVAVGVQTGGRHSVSLVAFDAATGRLRWKRDVVAGQQELNLFGEPVKELYAGVPAVADGTVYASTGLGVIAAADLRTGEARWVASYDTIEIERVDLWFTTPLRFPLWGPSPPIVHGDALVIAPPDGPFLCVFDRATGALRWRVEAEATASASEGLESTSFVDHLLGVARDAKRDVVVTTGRTLKAFDLASGGAPVWRAAIPDSEGSSADVRGRGALSKTIAYVPTKYGLSRFSIQGEGRYLGRDPWPEGAGPGNVLPFPRVLVVAGRGSTDGDTMRLPVQAFFAWDDVQKELDARRAAHPDDPRVAIEAADASRLAGQWQKAAALFDEAERLAGLAGSPDLAARARAGLHRTHRDRGDAEADAKHWLEARNAYEAALAKGGDVQDRIAVRLRLERVLSAANADAARVKNLEALADEAGEERAVFSADEGEIPAKAGALFRLAAVHAAANRAAAAVDVLERVLAEDPDATMPQGQARTLAKDEIARIVKTAGDGAYRRHEEAARDLLKRAEGDGGEAALERLLAVYPNAVAVPEALVRLADRQMERGSPLDAATTLRRLLETAPSHALVPRALAALARALAASGSAERARQALLRLERRYGDASFKMDGREWSGRQFAQTERARLGSARPVAVARALEPPLAEQSVVELDGEVESKVVRVAGADAAVGNVPVLVLSGDELIGIDTSGGRSAFRRRVGYVFAAAVAEDVIVISLASELVGLHPATGAEKWRREVGGAAQSMASVGGQVVALIEANAGGRKRLVAVDPVAGVVLWDRDLGREDYRDLKAGEEDLVVTHRKSTNPMRASVAVFAVLTGAFRAEFPLPADGLDIPPRLADGSTLLVAGREKGGERIEAWDLSGPSLRWRVPLEPPVASVIALIPRGDEVVVLDFDGKLKTLALSDGAVRRSTKVTGDLALVHGTSVQADDERVTLLLQDRTRRGATLASFSRATGRAAWVRSIAASNVQGADLLRSGRVFAVLVAQSVAGGNPTIEVRVVDAASGEVLQRLESPVPVGPMPTAVVQDGCLVVVGQEGVGIYKGGAAQPK